MQTPNKGEIVLTHKFVTKTGLRRAIEALITAEHPFYANPSTKYLMCFPRGMKLLCEEGLIPPTEEPHWVIDP